MLSKNDTIQYGIATLKDYRNLQIIIFIAVSINLQLQRANGNQSKANPENFESCGFVDSKSFLPPSLMTGSLHYVAKRAYNNGTRNIYQLTAEGRTLKITGTPLLVQRINELYALHKLRKLSKADEFGNALANSAGDKIKSVVGIIKDPIGTVNNLPKGASRVLGGIGEGLKGHKSKTEDGLLDSLAGTDKAKTVLAMKLGISPFTDNQELQKELTETARAAASGGVALGVAGSALTGGVGVALTVIDVNETLQETLVNSTPNDLRIINRKKLFALGLDRVQADAFLMHTQYTPWHKTIITDALARIGVNPEDFLRKACTASNQEEAYYFQRLAQLLLKYHSTRASLRNIRIENDTVIARDRDGTLVIPESFDYAVWNEHAVDRINEFNALLRSRKELKALAFWTDGQFSPRFCKELKKRKISWQCCRVE